MNNSRNKWLVFIIAVLLLTNIGLVWYFTGKKPLAPKNNTHGERPGSVTNFLKNELGFDAAQMLVFDSLKKQHRADIKPYFDELARSKDSFYQLISKGNIPDSVLNKAAAAIGEKQAVLDIHFFHNFQSLRKLCTPEQIQKFDSLMPGVAARLMEPWRKNNNHRSDSSHTSN